jgi:hypothetical protein
MAMDGAASIGGALNVAGDAALTGNVAVGGSLDVGGAAGFSSDVNVVGALAVGGTFNVNGAAGFVGDVGIGGNLDVLGSATVNGPATLTGGTVMTGGVSVDGLTGNVANASPTPPLGATPGTFWWDSNWKQTWVFHTSGSWAIAVNPPGMATEAWVQVQIANAVAELQQQANTIIQNLQGQITALQTNLQGQIDALNQRIDELPPYIVMGPTTPADPHVGLFWWNGYDLQLYVPPWRLISSAIAPTMAVWDAVPGPPSVWDGPPHTTDPSEWT